MTTKEDTLFLKSKHSNFSADHHDSQQQQYSNLDLNQAYKNCSDFSFVQSQSKIYNDKQFEDYCSENFKQFNVFVKWVKNNIASVFTVTDSTISHNNQKGKEETKFLNKSSNLSSYFSNDIVKKPWMNDSSSAAQTTVKSSSNNSTLSLHIAAYEKSVECIGDDSFGEMKGVQMKKELVKNWKNAKQIFSALSSTNQALFELPRQQNGKITEPEIAQFKASQKLLNPNQSSASNSVGSENANLIQQQQAAEVPSEENVAMEEAADEDEKEIVEFTPQQLQALQQLFLPTEAGVTASFDEVSKIINQHSR